METVNNNIPPNSNNNIKDSKFYKDFIKPNLPKTKKEWIGYIMVILIVVTLGLICTNQYLTIQHKAILILNPCNLCEDFQKNLELQRMGGGQFIKLNLSLVNITKP